MGCASSLAKVRGGKIWLIDYLTMQRYVRVPFKARLVHFFVVATTLHHVLYGRQICRPNRKLSLSDGRAHRVGGGERRQQWSTGGVRFAAATCARAPERRERWPKGPCRMWPGEKMNPSSRFQVNSSRCLMLTRRACLPLARDCYHKVERTRRIDYLDC